MMREITKDADGTIIIMMPVREITKDGTILIMMSAFTKDGTMIIMMRDITKDGTILIMMQERSLRTGKEEIRHRRVQSHMAPAAPAGAVIGPAVLSLASLLN